MTKVTLSNVTLSIASVALIAFLGVAKADDHLFNAQQHGLSTNVHSQGFANGDKAPGQGSPFTGEETHTPATATQSAIDHANTKERGGTPGHNAGGTPGHTNR
jgi:hypothetical protein